MNNKYIAIFEEAWVHFHHEMSRFPPRESNPHLKREMINVLFRVVCCV